MYHLFLNRLHNLISVKTILLEFVRISPSTWTMHQRLKGNGKVINICLRFLE